MESDIRRAKNLINGINLSNDDENMWLAPFINPNVTGASNLDFKDPITISCINIWNYSKTPERGVKRFEVLLDDQIIYIGELRPSKASNNLTSLIFSGNNHILEKVQASPYILNEGQPTAFSNEGSAFGQEKRKPLKYEDLERPQTGSLY